MFCPYPDYRRTDLKWFEHLPDSWAILRTKQMFRLVIEKAPANNQMELLSVYTHIGVRPRKSLEQRGNKASTTDGYWVVKEGDIICNKLLAWMGAIGASHYQGVTSPAYDILRPIKSCNTDYYHFLFRTKKYLQQFKIRSRGIMDMRLRLYFDQFGQIPIPVPPRHEQDQIVSYLRAQDAQIARFIKAKRELIELLTEQKLRIIDHGVTRGLDPTVPLKPSGIEWLGEMPVNWDTSRLKYCVSRIHAGGTPDTGVDSFWSDSSDGTPWLLIGDVTRADRVVTSTKRLTQAGLLSKRLTVVPAGAVLYTMYASIGKAAVLEIDAAINQAILGLEPKCDVLLPEFLFFWLRSLERHIRNLASTSTQANLNAAKVKALPVFLPTVEEQRLICDWIKSECRIFDDAIARNEDEIKLIREYRDRLIADVVTGQVDVRGWQPGPEDMVDDAALAALGDDSEDVTEEEDGDGED
ncbi:restriction endonuclease subunit S [Polynucleobacter sp. MWH-Aus1W21]|nr:restriction endonuclease subunit S [Polynucleobacter sp. MWH-Aus1W21]